MTPPVFKLVTQTRKRPYVLSGALPVSYWEDNFNGTPLPADWKPPSHHVHGTSYPLADAIAWKESLPLLSARAVELLEQVAPNCAEYRHFTNIKGVPYFVPNVLVAASSPLGGDCPPLFRRAASQLEGILCTEAVPAAVVYHKLTGFCFRDPSRSETRLLFEGKDTNVYPGVLA